MATIEYATVHEIIKVLKTFPAGDPVFICHMDNGGKHIFPIQAWMIRADRKCVFGTSNVSWPDTPTKASQAIQAWLNAKTTTSIPQVVQDYGGDRFPIKEWRHRFYKFPDGSWICTKGAGKSHRFAIGTGEIYTPELMEAKHG